MHAWLRFDILRQEADPVGLKLKSRQDRVLSWAGVLTDICLNSHHCRQQNPHNRRHAFVEPICIQKKVLFIIFQKGNCFFMIKHGHSGDWALFTFYLYCMISWLCEIWMSLFYETLMKWHTSEILHASSSNRAIQFLICVTLLNEAFIILMMQMMMQMN